MTEKLVRPVRCHICKKPMFYSGTKQHKPEVRVVVVFEGIEEDFYAHVKCWNELFEAKRRAG